MKNKYRDIMTICCAVFLLVFAVWGGNLLLTRLAELTNVTCRGQKFTTAEEAIQAMEAKELEENDISLDYQPPHELMYSFDYEGNTIVFYSFDPKMDEDSKVYAVRILKHNSDGTLSFDSGFADFRLSQPEENEYYYYFTDIKTSRGRKTISFLYLDKNTDKDIYVDGVQAEKSLVSMGDQEFYLCYAISRRDTFLKNLLTQVNARHRVEIK